MENAPPPIFFEKINQKKIEEKKYNLNINNSKYELIISLFEQSKVVIFNFKLINSHCIDNNNKLIFYETNKTSSELVKLFLVNISNCQNPSTKILEKIEKFHIANNVTLQKSTNDKIINLIYKFKAIDNEDIEFIIELKKRRRNK